MPIDLGMWLWLLLGWLAASGAVAVLHHRFWRCQRAVSPEVAAFQVRFETVLGEHHPEVRFAGMLPDQFACVLEVDGQETPVSLHDAFHHELAFPDAFPGYVARLIAEIRDVGLDRVEDVELAFVAPRLMPQVRSGEWLTSRGCFGDSGLVHRRLNDQLVTVYVVDDPNCMVFVCREHLRRWRKTEDDLHNLALANLARSDPEQSERLHAISGALRVQVGDGYDAARLLLLEQAEGLLVAVPDRDVLWVGEEAGADLESLMADTREIADCSPHPISARVFRVSDGQFAAVPAADRS